MLAQNFYELLKGFFTSVDAHDVFSEISTLSVAQQHKLLSGLAAVELLSNEITVDGFGETDGEMPT